MTDCPNGDVRDLLPELLHDRLDDASRRTVESHLASCADCQAELALLADMRAMMDAHPAIDVGAITAALPAAAPARRAARGQWLGWRTAAAITMLAAGGTSVALIQRNDVPVVRSDSVAVAVRAPVRADSATVTSTVPLATPPATNPASMPPASASPAPTKVRPRELAMAGSAVGDLTDKELAALLAHIDGLDGVPSPDVESVDLAPLPPREVRP